MSTISELGDSSEKMVFQPLKILVVDDQVGVRSLFEILIREEGDEAYIAQNGMEAVELACQVIPDLVFMDVKMPLMGGIEALERIKEVLPETDVVIMTSYGAEETLTRAMQKGALCFLAKPFDIGEIKEFIRRYRWKRAGVQATASGEYP
ncbi:MAG: response regulator [Eubacteriales bacterium]|nr:response regulator [Bacillota bacterium]